jgi:DNA modification methylase
MLIRGEDLKQSNIENGFASIFQPLYSIPAEPSEPIKKETGTYSPRNTLNNLTGTEWIKFTRSWFEFHPPPRNKKIGEDLHPAKFPETLIANFIEFFTKEGMWVLDPFAGTASTLVACDSTHRNGIGIELVDKWAEIGAKRTDQYLIQGDCRELLDYHIPSIDFCITSPPYWDMLGHSRGGSASTQKDRIREGFDAKFSDDERDLGNISEYDGFLDELFSLYQKIFQIMTPGKYCAVIMQNLLKENQEFYPIAWEFALKMRNYGWQLCQEFIWCQRDKKLGIWGFPNTYISNVHHHYILIFRKPNLDARSHSTKKKQ